VKGMANDRAVHRSSPEIESRHSLYDDSRRLILELLWLRVLKKLGLDLVLCIVEGSDFIFS
jgi:hypothetical protein